MYKSIITFKTGFANKKRSKINLALMQKELLMVTYRSLLDVVTPKERMSVPLRYRWLKFKTGFFGLTLQKGVVL